MNSPAFTDLLYPALGAAAGVLVAMLFRVWVLPRLSALASHTRTRIDDVIIEALGTPLAVWGALLGVQVGLPFTQYSDRVMIAARHGVAALVILSISWTIGRIAGMLVRPPVGASKTTLPSARIISSAAHASIITVGALVALETLGISVAPVLTALGVGGLAVGLALQDTLANLFSGFQILASHQLRVGDFIQISGGEQGVIQDITWRATTISQPGNNIVVVPNSKLAQAITINYSLPTTEQSVGIDLGVAYDEDLQRVEQVTLEVARSVQRDVPGAVHTYEPSVSFHTFADSRINFSVGLRARAFTDGASLKHELVKRLHARYRAEGIRIPVPERTLHVDMVTRGSAA